MKTGIRSWQAPLEVKVTCGLLVGIPLVYLLLAVVLLTSPGAGTRVFLVPGTTLLFGLLVAAGIALRMAFARVAAYAVVVIFGILHAFLLMGAELLWIKLFSLVAAAGYIYAGVLLSSGPVRRFVLGNAA
ncbi:hypothetical protein SAMN05216266_109126 [Amycolatopsis marina]|uniref:Uncharacterized protein n=1 Tax=Amycolatopsis marina TaxID=490629 RepID=A0A1I1AHP9_9PSEU|nr:hypothetical protein [Amycolatopsis marina]SFB37022.1 hypothetical protein SAMN05216266_109126 [Amycolatopsis marina]